MPLSVAAGDAKARKRPRHQRVLRRPADENLVDGVHVVNLLSSLPGNTSDVGGGDEQEPALMQRDLLGPRLELDGLMGSDLAQVVSAPLVVFERSVDEFALRRHQIRINAGLHESPAPVPLTLHVRGGAERAVEHQAVELDGVARQVRVGGRVLEVSRPAIAPPVPAFLSHAHLIQLLPDRRVEHVHALLVVR